MENSLCQGHIPVLGGDGEQGSIIRSGSRGLDEMMRYCFCVFFGLFFFCRTVSLKLNNQNRVPTDKGRQMAAGDTKNALRTKQMMTLIILNVKNK